MGNTIFHKIIRREIPADVVFEDEDLIAFRDIQPAAPIHILLVPKKTIAHAGSVNADDAELIGKLVVAAKKIAEAENVTESGYRLVFNVGDDAGNSVPQLHLHLLGGRKMNWPPG